MTITTTITPSKSKRRLAKPALKAKDMRQRSATADKSCEAGANDQPRVTKQERVLTLLSRSSGASIEEMMQATNWQQHSVRGFLAGTVKNKLGFELSSEKDEGDVRRYRIATKRRR